MRSFSAGRDEGRVDRDACEPSREFGPTVKGLQMNVGFHPRILNHIFSGGSISRGLLDPLEGFTRVSLPQLRKGRPQSKLGRRNKNVIGCRSGKESYADFIMQFCWYSCGAPFCKEDRLVTSGWSLFCKDVVVSVVTLFCPFSSLRRFLG